jgi:hypothetical protein
MCRLAIVTAADLVSELCNGTLGQDTNSHKTNYAADAARESRARLDAVGSVAFSAGIGGSVVFSHRLPRRDRERDVHSVARQITRRDPWVQRNGCRGKSDAIGERHRMLCNLGPPDKGGESRQDAVMPAISKPECTHPNGGHFVEERTAVDHSSRWQR